MEKKIKQKNYILKALNGVKKYAILTPLMMIGEVVMECLIPIIMAFLVDFLNISKLYIEGFVTLPELTTNMPNIDPTRIKAFLLLMDNGFAPLGSVALCGGLIIITSVISV